MSRTVYNYDTASRLPGRPTRELVAASDAAEPTGAVLAHRVGSWWHHVPDSRLSDIERIARGPIVTVYVAR